MSVTVVQVDSVSPSALFLGQTADLTLAGFNIQAGDAVALVMGACSGSPSAAPQRSVVGTLGASLSAPLTAIAGVFPGVVPGSPALLSVCWAASATTPFMDTGVTVLLEAIGPAALLAVFPRWVQATAAGAIPAGTKLGLVGPHVQAGDGVFLSELVPGTLSCSTVTTWWNVGADGIATVPADVVVTGPAPAADAPVALGVCYRPKGVVAGALLNPPAFASAGSAQAPLSSYVLLVTAADCADGRVTGESARLVNLELSLGPAALVRGQLSEYYVAGCTLAGDVYSLAPDAATCSSAAPGALFASGLALALGTSPKPAAFTPSATAVGSTAQLCLSRGNATAAAHGLATHAVLAAFAGPAAVKGPTWLMRGVEFTGQLALTGAADGEEYVLVPTPATTTTSLSSSVCSTSIVSQARGASAADPTRNPLSAAKVNRCAAGLCGGILASPLDGRVASLTLCGRKNSTAPFKLFLSLALPLLPALTVFPLTVLAGSTPATALTFGPATAGFVVAPASLAAQTNEGVCDPIAYQPLSQDISDGDAAPAVNAAGPFALCLSYRDSPLFFYAAWGLRAEDRISANLNVGASVALHAGQAGPLPIISGAIGFGDAIGLSLAGGSTCDPATTTFLLPPVVVDFVPGVSASVRLPAPFPQDSAMLCVRLRTNPPGLFPAAPQGITARIAQLVSVRLGGTVTSAPTGLVMGGQPFDLVLEVASGSPLDRFLFLSSASSSTLQGAAAACAALPATAGTALGQPSSPPLSPGAPAFYTFAGVTVAGKPAVFSPGTPGEYVACYRADGTPGLFYATPLRVTAVDASGVALFPATVTTGRLAEVYLTAPGLVSLYLSTSQQPVVLGLASAAPLCAGAPRESLDLALRGSVLAPAVAGSYVLCVGAGPAASGPSGLLLAVPGFSLNVTAGVGAGVSVTLSPVTASGDVYALVDAPTTLTVAGQRGPVQNGDLVALVPVAASCGAAADASKAFKVASLGPLGASVTIVPIAAGSFSLCYFFGALNVAGPTSPSDWRAVPGVTLRVASVTASSPLSYVLGSPASAASVRINLQGLNLSPDLQAQPLHSVCLIPPSSDIACPASCSAGSPGFFSVTPVSPTSAYFDLPAGGGAIVSATAAGAASGTVRFCFQAGSLAVGAGATIASPPSVLADAARLEVRSLAVTPSAVTVSVATSELVNLVVSGAGISTGDSLFFAANLAGGAPCPPPPATPPSAVATLGPKAPSLSYWSISLSLPTSPPPAPGVVMTACYSSGGSGGTYTRMDGAGPASTSSITVSPVGVTHSPVTVRAGVATSVTLSGTLQPGDLVRLVPVSLGKSCSASAPEDGVAGGDQRVVMLPAGFVISVTLATTVGPVSVCFKTVDSPTFAAVTTAPSPTVTPRGVSLVTPSTLLEASSTSVLLSGSLSPGDFVSFVLALYGGCSKAWLNEHIVPADMIIELSLVAGVYTVCYASASSSPVSEYTASSSLRVKGIGSVSPAFVPVSNSTVFTLTSVALEAGAALSSLDRVALVTSGAACTPGAALVNLTAAASSSSSGVFTFTQQVSPQARPCVDPIFIYTALSGATNDLPGSAVACSAEYPSYIAQGMDLQVVPCNRPRVFEVGYPGTALGGVPNDIRLEGTYLGVGDFVKLGGPGTPCVAPPNGTLPSPALGWIPVVPAGAGSSDVVIPGYTPSLLSNVLEMCYYYANKGAPSAPAANPEGSSSHGIHLVTITFVSASPTLFDLSELASVGPTPSSPPPTQVVVITLSGYFDFSSDSSSDFSSSSSSSSSSTAAAAGLWALVTGSDCSDADVTPYYGSLSRPGNLPLSITSSASALAYVPVTAAAGPLGSFLLCVNPRGHKRWLPSPGARITLRRLSRFSPPSVVQDLPAIVRFSGVGLNFNGTTDEVLFLPRPTGSSEDCAAAASGLGAASVLLARNSMVTVTLPAGGYVVCYRFSGGSWAALKRWLPLLSQARSVASMTPTSGNPYLSTTFTLTGTGFSRGDEAFFANISTSGQASCAPGSISTVRTSTIRVRVRADSGVEFTVPPNALSEGDVSQAPLYALCYRFAVTNSTAFALLDNMLVRFTAEAVALGSFPRIVGSDLVAAGSAYLLSFFGHGLAPGDRFGLDNLGGDCAGEAATMNITMVYPYLSMGKTTLLRALGNITSAALSSTAVKSGLFTICYRHTKTGRLTALPRALRVGACYGSGSSSNASVPVPAVSCPASAPYMCSDRCECLAQPCSTASDLATNPGNCDNFIGYVYCAGSGMCMPRLQDCPTAVDPSLLQGNSQFYSCPESASHRCSQGGLCAVSPLACPPVPACPRGFQRCADGSCAEAVCSDPEPPTCDDPFALYCPAGMCSSRGCPPLDGCPAEAAVRCADGSCAASDAECESINAAKVCADSDTPYRCRDGSCSSAPGLCPLRALDPFVPGLSFAVPSLLQLLQQRPAVRPLALALKHGRRRRFSLRPQAAAGPIQQYLPISVDVPSAGATAAGAKALTVFISGPAIAGSGCALSYRHPGRSQVSVFEDGKRIIVAPAVSLTFSGSGPLGEDTGGLCPIADRDSTVGVDARTVYSLTDLGHLTDATLALLQCNVIDGHPAMTAFAETLDGQVSCRLNGPFINGTVVLTLTVVLPTPTPTLPPPASETPTPTPPATSSSPPPTPTKKGTAAKTQLSITLLVMVVFALLVLQ